MSTWIVAITGSAVCLALTRAARRADAGERARLIRQRARWRVPPRARAPFERALADADIELTPEAALELVAIGIAALGLGTAVVAPGLLVPVLLAAVVGAPVALHVARARRERRFVAAVPGALEQVAAELRGGGSVAGAIERLGGSDSAAARDFARVHVRTRLGLALGDALAAWPVEHDAPGVRAVAGSLAVASSLGGRAAGALDGLASSLRDRLDAAAEARSLSTQARLSAVVVGAAPVGYLVFASLVDARSVGALTGTGVGRVCLVVGLGLEALAAWWIRRIVAEPS